MIKIIITTITLFLIVNVSAQTFKTEGFRMITEKVISESKIEQILAYNFENYRKQNYSIILKIIDGPTIELFSISEIKTGIKPTYNGAHTTKIDVDSHKNEVTNTKKHKELSLIKMTTITVF
jgi:hypothetical protein